MFQRRLRPILLCGIAAALLMAVKPSPGDPELPSRSMPGRTALSTEDFLNHLGVNTHLDGLTQSDPWNTNAALVGTQLNYLGVRLDRDWAHSADTGKKWKDVQKAWSPYGRFWTSIDEAGPQYQRSVLAYEEAIYQTFPGLIYAMGGPNEPDNTYPQGEGATLPDSALVQQSLHNWAHLQGRNIPVSQMEFGSGWTAANHWQGDYNPGDTGIHQNYTAGPAEIGAAHTYLHVPGQRPVDVLNQLRLLAALTTPGKPIAHTEIGAYRSANFSAAVFGQYLVMGAFDSAAAGDAAYIVYGLQDSAPENTYGFFSYPGNTAHEAARYFHTLTTLLKSDTGRCGPGSAPSFKPASPAVTFSNPTTSHLVMQKPTGQYVIANWSEQVMTGVEPIRVLRDVKQCILHMKPSDTYLLVFGADTAK